MSISRVWPWWRLVAAVACAGIVLAKLALIFRININWDEFYFLTHVHALLRGDLSLLLQGAYTHVFAWLAAVDGDEIRQLHAARAACWALFALGALLLHRLTAILVAPRHAGVAVLAYLAASPVLVHGASFRADSLLLPLTLAGMVLLAIPRTDAARRVWAGVAFGAAAAVSVKAALFAPAVATLVCARLFEDRAGQDFDWRGAIRALATIAAVAAVTAAVLLAAHAATLPASPPTPVSQDASEAFRKTLLDVPWMPRAAYFDATVETDPVTWWLILAGTVAAALRRRWAIVACVLSLLPILFYRNAFPYYYLLMLATASVAAASASEWIETRLVASGRTRFAELACGALVLALALQAANSLQLLRHDGQAAQRTLVAAVHRIFPAPVPYIDHSGMIASFPKVGIFMSTWGIEAYRDAGAAFVGPALATRRPPLLVANRPVIDPDSPAFRRLLPEDQRLIRQSYVRYWGPIWVAGIEAKVPVTGAVSVALPFPGRYRLETRAPVEIGGRRFEPSAIVDAGAGPLAVAQPAGASGESTIRLVWAAAQAPPRDPPPFGSIYRGL